jgi:MFS transporter, ACS family, hexuronate transporter
MISSPHSSSLPAGSDRFGRGVGWWRWGVCALLFFSTTINYIDRQIIGILKPTLAAEFGWKDEHIYAAIVFSFQLAYAIGLLLAGRLTDWLGTRRGLAWAVALWSVAAIAHAGAAWFPNLTIPSLSLDAAAGLVIVPLAGAAAGFALMRFLLGLGEAANFPASIKTVSEWFPKRERALATGIFNSGSNVGAVVTPLIVPIVTLKFGWQWAFVITGLTGAVWLIFWLKFYRPPEKQPKISDTELAYIRSDPAEEITPIPLRKLLRHRPLWAFSIGKFLTDPIWWLYLFWIPDFLNRNHGLDLRSIGPPIVVIYVVADIGSIGGGWLSSRLLKNGWTTNRARKTAMLVCAVAAVPIMAAARVSELWAAVWLVALAAAAHQGWSANLFTLVSDTFPRSAVGSVVGFGGMAGAVGGMLISLVVGEILQRTGSYATIFVIAGSGYLAALTIIHLLVPRLEPAKV